MTASELISLSRAIWSTRPDARPFDNPSRYWRSATPLSAAANLSRNAPIWAAAWGSCDALALARSCFTCAAALSAWRNVSTSCSRPVARPSWYFSSATVASATAARRSTAGSALICGPCDRSRSKSARARAAAFSACPIRSLRKPSACTLACSAAFTRTCALFISAATRCAAAASEPLSR